MTGNPGQRSAAEMHSSGWEGTGDEAGDRARLCSAREQPLWRAANPHTRALPPGTEPPITPELSRQEPRQDSKETGQRCLGLSHKIAKNDNTQQI